MIKQLTRVRGFLAHSKRRVELTKISIEIPLTKVSIVTEISIESQLTKMNITGAVVDGVAGGGDRVRGAVFCGGGGVELLPVLVLALQPRVEERSKNVRLLGVVGQVGAWRARARGRGGKGVR